jgi:hypothetical protein
MVIKEAEPWLLWPSMVSYGLNKGSIGDTFEGESSFCLEMTFKVISKEPSKRTLFAKLPSYMGVDIEGDDNKLLLILNLRRDGETYYEYLMSEVGIGWNLTTLIFKYNKEERTIRVSVNENVLITYKLKEREILNNGNDPHIIFGAGNFPHNGFNLNYCSYQVEHLRISKDDEVLGLYDFKKRTDYKIYDFTGNCNFIHKIL